MRLAQATTKWPVAPNTQSTVFGRPAPPSVYWRDDRTIAIDEAIREDVLLRVLGRNKSQEELWSGYGQHLVTFTHLVAALAQNLDPLDELSRADTLARIVAHDVEASALDIDSSEVEYLVAAGQRNMNRTVKALDRVRKAGLQGHLLETTGGQSAMAAMMAFSWGLTGLRVIIEDPTRFSNDDLFFCLLLMRVGPRDAFAFVRAFELDQQEDDAQLPLTTRKAGAERTLDPELEQLERVEFDAGERLLAQVEDHDERTSE